MKSLVRALVVFLGIAGSLSNASFAQSGWTLQDSGTTETLFAVSFVDANTGTAVGDAGIILRTIDGGETWTPQNSGTDRGLRSVSFADTNTGVAVGLGTTALWTNDGGDTWVRSTISALFPTNLVAAVLVDASTGFAVGEVRIGPFCRGGCAAMWKTIDGGAHWSSLMLSASGSSLWGISFADSNSGMALGSPRSFRTTDGGLSWAGMPSISGFFRVSMGTANTATAVTGSTILRTTDGGDTWSEQSSGTTAFLQGVSFVDDSIGTVVGGGGAILNTTDGGDTWTPQESGTTDTLFAVSFVDANTGWAVGAGGTILRTITAGR